MLYSLCKKRTDRDIFFSAYRSKNQKASRKKCGSCFHFCLQQKLGLFRVNDMKFLHHAVCRLNHI